MRHKLLILGALGVLALTAATAAIAGNITATATLSGTAGVSLGLPGNPSVSDTLDGTDQTVTYAPVLSVVDARGSGGGWNMTISATSFSDGSGHSLTPGSISSVAQACHSSSACTAPTNAIGYPLTVNGSAAKFFNATANTGLGKIDVTPSVDVLVPGNAFAGTYTSTVTLAVATGP